jgi:hypothetical protein
VRTRHRKARADHLRLVTKHILTLYCFTCNLHVKAELVACETANIGIRCCTLGAAQHAWGYRDEPDSQRVPDCEFERRGRAGDSMTLRMEASTRTQTILIYWAWIFSTAYFLAYYFLIKLLPLPPATLTAAQVANFYILNSTQIRLGAAVCSWTAAFTIPLAIVIAIQMARLEKGFPIWSIVQFTGGVMMSIFTVLPPLLWGVAAFTPTRPPEVTLVIHEFGNLAFIATDQYFIFQNIGLAVVCFTQKADDNSPFPRWIGYLTLWTAFVIEVGVAAFLPKTGPFAWNGLFVYWLPIAMYGAWYMTVSISILRALKRQSAA